MKRYNGLYGKICSIDNLMTADRMARKGKHNKGIAEHDRHRDEDLIMLLNMLLYMTYRTSEYSYFRIYEPKARDIARLPFYPDRIVHWAIMLIMESIWMRTMTTHTYSCISGRGIRRCSEDIRKALRKDPEGTRYCLKLDIRRFYPSIDHDILKDIIRKKVKDRKLLALLSEIIDSADGVPIGNYLSQFFANLYLTYFDHWMLEEKKKMHCYYRYADDMVILSDSKEKLHRLFREIRTWLKTMLKLDVKSNWQVFPVDSRGIDFVGYRFFHTHTLVRKRIKTRILRLAVRYGNGKIPEALFRQRFTAYFGWMKYSDSKHLLQKIEELTGKHYSNWRGKEVPERTHAGRRVYVTGIMTYSRYWKIHYTYKGHSYAVKTKDAELVRHIGSQDLPRKMTIR